MQEEFRNCGCTCGCKNNSNAFLGGLFNTNGNGDSTILFFIIVFLLLFTNFGCCNR